MITFYYFGFHRGGGDQFTVNLHSKLDPIQINFKINYKFNKIFFFYICDLECLIYSNIKQIGKKKKKGYF